MENKPKKEQLKFVNSTNIILFIPALIVSMAAYFMKLSFAVNSTIEYETTGNLTFSDAILGNQEAVALLSKVVEAQASFVTISRIVIAIIAVASVILYKKQNKGIFSSIFFIAVAALLASLIYSGTLSAVCG